MRKVCRTYLDDLHPYDPKILLGIALIFMVIGFLYIPLYTNIVLRYGFTLLLCIAAFSQRKRFAPLFGNLFGKKVTP